ncbi:16S rRNA (adenine(1518)-N(6)/adenine(1519)-N(6))-dimethyltransferase RsmA [Corynebacterium mendelii]|uniref:Ribosomal RNA small subunit methyltransferase A n=1 Tax=Corynebacterium mendelii TaxID=2765362 RepID=A0A939IXR0_9CORY|nr:16S rRNA (adenine(1518)-N(6)/adenine(1519)-N(6))-dimethyltransferase RsmA [Corynebacterium mendelii]MBN9644735.1 16S rRNA (adenine(1518)-N(6)/adenine(1519)-N(6))-dimethyltransferase RsmA [Corynebacterium mendelii]
MTKPQAEYLGPKEILAILAATGATPTKKFGQNFLHDPNTVRKIVAASGIGASDDVLEVGPGLGSLTLGLLDTARSVTAVEIDPSMLALLETTIATHAAGLAEKLTVFNADAMTFDRDRLTAAGCPLPRALVANLPYNVAVPIIIHMLTEFPSLTRVLVMVQKEVADRLAAAPGSKVYGVPSVKASFFGSVSRVGLVPRTVFHPVPNVDSALVKIERFAPGSCPWPQDETTRQHVFRLVDAAFAQRRKTLRAALKQFYGSAAAAEEALVGAGISPSARGEILAVDDFVRLARYDRQQEQ